MGSKPSERVLTVSGDKERQDQLFDALSHPHRRFTLQYLQTADTPLSVETLAAELETWNGQQHPTERSEAASAIEVTLVHNHLPRLADAGLIGYDNTQQTVTLTDRTGEARSHL